ncbi:CrcB-like protein-domain-containing protein [Podospora didyma]|uniref:CrcB-like protein-domain-containing protein n=1 Tax=Podospora didyma TaxID=330526 RepID=A0AAE0KF95_9PEZI|nr:CrcB-like protein-domain-containing protein [Podospora didyma]
MPPSHEHGLSPGRGDHDHLSSQSPAEVNTPESCLEGIPSTSNADDAAASQAQVRRSSSGTSARIRPNARRVSTVSRANYDVPESYINLDEAVNVSPIQNPVELPVRQFESLEDVRSRDREYFRGQRSRPAGGQEAKVEESEAGLEIKVSRLATQIYTVSYLVLFSILGTLARLGLQTLTASYPGTPVVFSSLWPNLAGSLVMGFLAEDRMLFSEDWSSLVRDDLIQGAVQQRQQGNSPVGSCESSTQPDLAAAKKAHSAMKKTIPLYIGLATGFCGSFTSFSSFMRDMFFALSNDLGPSSSPRSGGYSFMAVVAVLLVTVSLSLSGLFIGAHLAIALEPFTPSLPYLFTCKVVDRLAVVLGWGCWVGAVVLCIWPPDRSRGDREEAWRGAATFALAFAPLGCLIRFYASVRLNARIASFPLGTFAVNVLGTAILGMAWDLAHIPSGGGVIGCQVLQGIQDGFCGCLTTVSTWVVELAALRRRHAYGYGTASVSAGLALLVAIMGGLKWSEGIGELLCTH